MVRRADSYLEIMMKYTDSQQRPLLYIVDECFNLYYLSYIARVGMYILFTTQIVIYT